MFSSVKHSYSIYSTLTRSETDTQLEHMVNDSVMPKGKEDKIPPKQFLKRNSSANAPSIANSAEQKTRMSNKRRTDTSNRLVSSCNKTVTNVTNMPLPSSTISTKTFYSNSQISKFTNNVISSPQSFNVSIKARKIEQNRRKVLHYNKGVSHKIRRRIKQSEIVKCDMHSPIDYDHILNSIRNDKLRELIICRRQEKEQVELIHRILNSSQDPIRMAKPLSTIIPTNNYLLNNENKFNGKFLTTSSESNSPDFSDLESFSDDGDNVQTNRADQVTPPTTYYRKENSHTPTESKNNYINLNARRKFFKSRGSTCSIKEVQITSNIKAEMCNGKITLVKRKKVKKRKLKAWNLVGNEFSAEQATVDTILQNLDDSLFDNTEPLRSVNDKKTTNTKEALVSGNSIQYSDHTDFAVFRNQIPYNTTNPELIEQQHLLLDFLINNNICTKENFKIFIADPNNHKEAAAYIVDHMIVVINGESKSNNKSANCERNCDTLLNNECVIKENLNTSRISERGNTQGIIPSQTPEITGEIPSKITNLITQTLDYNMKIQADNLNKNSTQGLMCRTEGSSDLVSKKFFPIFYKGMCQPLPQKTSRRILRNSRKGQDANQYQIDAGQKDFGAQQCKQCGLMYTVHEPEEENLHRDYHESLYILRFKGWTDEDVVAFYPDWATDGRIIRISNNSHIKRIERLKEILNIVDKELGFSSYTIPRLFVAYLAVRKCQIVGLCLVQPLEKAHKYLYVNNLDCCTDEEFEAKCGISRIWVSPLQRRLRIGSKLIRAVQLHTILGEEIHFDKLAFSAPTEDGKQFARRVTKMEQFLVYF